MITLTKSIEDYLEAILIIEKRIKSKIRRNS